MLIKKYWRILIALLIFSNKTIFSMQAEKHSSSRESSHHINRKRKKSSEATSSRLTGEKQLKIMPGKDSSPISNFSCLSEEVRAFMGTIIIKDTIKKCTSMQRWRDSEHALEAPFQRIYRGNEILEENYHNVEYSRQCLMELSNKMPILLALYEDLIKPVRYKKYVGIEALFYYCGSKLNSTIAPLILGSVSTPPCPKALASLKAYTERYPGYTKRAVSYLIQWINDELNKKDQERDVQNKLKFRLALAQKELKLTHSNYETNLEYQLVATLQEALNEKDYKKGQDALQKYRKENWAWLVTYLTDHTQDNNKIPFIDFFEADSFFCQKTKMPIHQPETLLFLQKALLKIKQVDKNFTVPPLGEIIPSSPHIQTIWHLLSRSACPLSNAQLASIKKSKEILFDEPSSIDYKVTLLNTLMYLPVNFTKAIGASPEEGWPLETKEHPYFVYNSVLSIMAINKKHLKNNPAAQQGIINYAKKIIAASIDKQAQGEIPEFIAYLMNIPNNNIIKNAAQIIAYTLAARNSLKASKKSFNDFGKEAEKYMLKSYSNNYLKRMLWQQAYDLDIMDRGLTADSLESYFCDQMEDFFKISS